ncbi:MAG: oligosaccharide flippase family protein [Euryarchaeota archaeon]|nr:oligosaccharide flippase family protein [Euryarchaeota archaeon]
MTHGESAKRFTLDTFWALLSLATMIGVGIIIGILIGNLGTGKIGLGTYSMVLTVWTIVYVTAGFGIPNTVIKFVAEYKDNKEERDSIVSTSIVTGVAMGVSTSIALFLLSWYIEALFGMPNLGFLLRMVSLAFPFIVINDIFIGILNARRMMRHYAIFEVFRRGNLLVYTIAFVWLGLGIPGAVMALVLSPMSASVVAIAYHSKLFTFRLKSFRARVKRIVKFSGQLYMSSSVELVNAQAATILIAGFMKSADAVGTYATALMLFTLLVVLSQAIQRVTFPAFSTYFGQGNGELVERMTKIIIRFTFVLLSIASLILIFFVDDIIRVIFPTKYEYLAAVTPLRFLAVIGVIYGMMVAIGSIFTSANRPDISLKIAIFQAIFNVSVAVLLIPISYTILGIQIGGVNGATIAFGLTLFLTVIIFFVLMKSMLRFNLGLRFVIVGYILFLAVVTAGFFLTSYLGFEGNLVGAILIPLYSAGLLYFGLVFKGGLQAVIEILGFRRPST